MKNTLLFLISSFFLFSAHTSVHEKTSKFFSIIAILFTNPTLPATPYNYANPSLPSFFNTSPITSRDNTPTGNTITDEGATLGRVLFYDTNLSFNNTISCASCHAQADAFGDPNQFSIGFDGQLTNRNSPQLTNGRYYENSHFFWDERADELEDQVLMPIESTVEMGEDLSTLPTKLTALGYYDVLFTDAFGDAIITTTRMSQAMAQFVRSMVSYQSKYDAGVPTGSILGDFDNFDADENAGKALFEQHCDNCHKTAVQIADEPFNIGLTDGSGGNEDLGVGGITEDPDDDGKFKVPSLRNIEVSAPYMHDGSLTTLADVINHYDNGIENHPNLPGALKDGGQPQNLGLTATEKLQLEAFLETLTDNTILTDIKFSNPFATVLPVEFVDFQARIDLGIAVDLEWTTATEINNDYFEVQHSMTGTDFETIHIEESRTAQNGYHYYQFRDEAPAAGRNYYRIKQIDFDGRFSYSVMKHVYIQESNFTKINIYPTTTEDLVFIKVESNEDKEVDVLISNSNGQIIFETKWNLTTGTQTFNLNTYDWANGLHFINIHDGQTSKQFRVVKS